MVILVASGCASHKTTLGGKSSLEEAIHYYIEGDLERAEALFTKVTQQQNSDEDVQTAYLYLGRIYMAWGDYERAAEAFSTGRVLGGDIRFDEYFARVTRRRGGSTAAIAREPHVTRAQLAVLIVSVFGPALETDGIDSVGPTLVDTGRAQDTRDHWAENSIEAVKQTGVMPALPDGRFHPDEKVTRSAFFFVMSRLVAAVDVERGVMAELYPGGYRDTLTPRDAGRDGEPRHDFVSGREVLESLERLALAAGY